MKKIFPASLIFASIAGLGVYYFLQREQPMESVPSTSSITPAISNGVATREVSSVPPVKGRIPTTSNPVERLDRESDGKWVLKRDRAGFVKRMSGGSLPLGSRAPSVAAAEFAKRYGEALLGVSPTDLVAGDSKQEGPTAQVIYSQIKDELPVFGSRINMIFDREGNLVHLVSDVYSGQFPPSRPRIDAAAAAAALRLGIAQRLERDGQALEDNAFPNGELESWAVLGYRISGGGVNLVYRFHFSLADPAYGDMEAFVDAQTGSLVLLRTLTRN